MFYHALIGNGGTPEPIENLEPVLLWTNSNPTAEFAAQTISLDLTDYAGVIIECLYSTNKQNLTSRVYIKKGETLIGGCNTESYPNVRLITAINDEGISFGVARDSNTHNDNVIPYKIYGIKEYVVEPQIGDLLWTNSSPTANQGEISIPLDYTKYSKIKIVAKYSNNSDHKVESVGEARSGYKFGAAITDETLTAVRSISLNDGNISIGSGYVLGSPLQTDNSKCIITELYGIE